MMPPIDVLIASCRDVPGGAPDDLMLVEEIHRLGGTAAIAAWEDETVDWSRATATIVRSTWNYHRDVRGWYEWLDHVERRTLLFNSPDTLRWNAHKSYLFDLEECGVPIVPTRLISRGDRSKLMTAIAECGWHDVVAKPAIGASGCGARRFVLPCEEALLLEHAAGLLRGGALLLQPFQPAVLTEGERSLVFIGSKFTHAYAKPAFHAGISAGDPETILDASAAEIILARRALSTVDPSPLYARVDLVPSASGSLLMELELIEPHLAFRLCPESCSLLSACLMDPLTWTE